MITAHLRRQEAEALIDAVLSTQPKPVHKPWVRGALTALTMACGMITSEDDLDAWLLRQERKLDRSMR